MPGFLPVLAALPLVGCAMIAEPFDLEEELDLATETSPEGPVVDGISPVWGLSTGGTQVTISGSRFDPSAVVRFGSLEADILEGVEDSMIVRLPSTDTAGWVDVTVETDSGKVVLDDAFRYLADGAGLAGVVGYVEYVEYVGDYWDSPPDPTVEFKVGFVEPLDFAWEDTYGVGVDQCQYDYGWGGSLTELPLGLSEIRLTGGGDSITLPYDNETGYFRADLDAADYSFSTAYDLEEVSPDGLPTFDVADLVRTPSSSFTITSPAFEGSSVPTVSSTVTLTWSGGGGDLLLLRIGQRNSSGSDYVGMISCIVDNDGSFTVPNLWSSWPSSRQIDFWFTMMRDSSATLSLNGSNSGVVGLYSKLGAAFSY